MNEFDIAVALALDKGELELRDRIEAFHQTSQLTKFYVNTPHQDSEAAIAPLGEWVLFAACVGVKGIAPKRGQYRNVVRDVFGAGSGDPDAALARLLGDVEWAMETLGEHGAPTRQLLPALPPMHVLAGLRETYATLKKSVHRNVGRKLIEAYLCRSFFSDRYEAQGNDRLFADFQRLKQCILNIRSTGALKQDDLPLIFNPESYAVPDAHVLGNLQKPVSWIKSASRLGRAVATIQLAGDPLDWVTGEKLDSSKVQSLHEAGELDRHHVFPQKLLKDLFKRQEVNHALNGVVLRSSSNNYLADGDPADYIKRTLKEPHAPAESTLRKRIQSHLIPYDVLVSTASVEERYAEFIKQRAALIAQRIAEKCALPGL